jgi:RND family efflux transporter MFP subunit
MGSVMNMESGIESNYVELDEAGARRRRMIIIASVVAVVVVIAAVLFLRNREKPAVVATDTAPGITVLVPGRHSITTEVAAVGNISARRDMPVGIAGEGGTVLRVLAEAGDWVKAGQTLAVIDRSVQAQQAAALAATIRQQQADAALAKSNLERAKKLVSNGFVSKADIDQRQATLDSANARVAVAQAQLRQQQALIGRLDIRSPTGGLVLTRAIEAGQTVGAGSTALFRVAENGNMELQARLSEADLARVHVGSPATVTPVGTALQIVGKIWQVSPVIDPNTRQGMVRIALPYNVALRPGGFAAAQIGGGVGDVPLLPESAVLSDQKGNYVYLVGPENKVIRRDVKVGDVDDRGVSILAGLTGTEKVVASAGAFLNPGDKVKPQSAPSPR